MGVCDVYDRLCGVKEGGREREGGREEGGERERERYLASSTNNIMIHSCKLLYMHSTITIHSNVSATLL